MHLKSSLALLGLTAVHAFNSNSQSNVGLYWGQNSQGGQQPLATYCDDSSDIFLISFLHIFHSAGGLPEVNFANACGGPSFPGTNLFSCPQIGEDIKTCQAKGKKMIMSLGGATGGYGFTDDAQAIQFADLLWDLFGNGTSSTRPFGDAVVDGFDLDIEGGSSTGYAAFALRMKQHFIENEAVNPCQKMLLTAAPQCPLPDFYLNDAILNSPIDIIFVQFYNNYCGIDKYIAGDPKTWFNFADWDSFVKTQAFNKDAKVYIGVPGGVTGAGTGYVPASTVISAAKEMAEQFSTFGGVMMWDASQAHANPVSPGVNFAQFIKQQLLTIDNGGDDEEECVISTSSRVPQTSTTQVISSATSAPITTSEVSPTTSSTGPVEPTTSSLRSSTSASSIKTSSSSIESTSAPVPSSSTMECDESATGTTATATATITFEPTASTSATSPSTTSSAPPSPSCPVPGGVCEQGDTQCFGQNYIQCLNGRWLVRPCAPGTVCRGLKMFESCDFTDSNGGIVGDNSQCVEDSLDKRETLPFAPILEELGEDTATNANDPETKEFVGDAIFYPDDKQYQLTFDSQKVDDTFFKASILISTLTSPIGQDWTLNFTSPLELINATRGTLINNGHDSYTIKSLPEQEPGTRMRVDIRLMGKRGNTHIPGIEIPPQCPKPGGECGSVKATVCLGANFITCHNGRWLKIACPDDQVCRNILGVGECHPGDEGDNELCDGPEPPTETGLPGVGPTATASQTMPIETSPGITTAQSSSRSASSSGHHWTNSTTRATSTQPSSTGIPLTTGGGSSSTEVTEATSTKVSMSSTAEPASSTIVVSSSSMEISISTGEPSTTAEVESTSTIFETFTTTECPETALPSSSSISSVMTTSSNLPSSSSSSTPTSTSIPSPSSTPVVCPVIGGPCDPEGQSTCFGKDYAQCIHGTWLQRPCAPGTVCKALIPGVISCDFTDSRGTTLGDNHECVLSPA